MQEGERRHVRVHRPHRCHVRLDVLGEEIQRQAVGLVGGQRELGLYIVLVQFRYAEEKEVWLSHELIDVFTHSVAVQPIHLVRPQ